MRQMGGAYAYSFDVTALLIGVCFNLAGLPYSAGFIGKELLLFQTLRNDFTSLLVRSCWMVSFFFTPIYMFLLVFVVSFGTKKGALAAYSFAWRSLFTQVFWLLTNFHDLPQRGLKKRYKKYVVRFQHTALTSRFTIYVLTSFWFFFFFFGEALLLITLNYNTLTDAIPSDFFLYTKTHSIFNTFSSTSLLSEVIFFFIVIFTGSSFAFLLNLKFSHTYHYTRTAVLIDTLLLFLVISLFFPIYCPLPWVFTLLIVRLVFSLS